jgi:hypothetical protein
VKVLLVRGNPDERERLGSGTYFVWSQNEVSRCITWFKADQPAVGDRAPKDKRMQHSRQCNVVHKTTGTR